MLFLVSDRPLPEVAGEKRPCPMFPLHQPRPLLHQELVRQMRSIISNFSAMSNGLPNYRLRSARAKQGSFDLSFTPDDRIHSRLAWRKRVQCRAREDARRRPGI